MTARHPHATLEVSGSTAFSAGSAAVSAAAAAVSGSNGLRRKYQRIAPWYDVLDWPFEWTRYRRIRPEVFAPVCEARRLLDCGVGTGRNLRYYPARAAVTAFDLSPAMLARARRRARQIRPDVTLLHANVLALPLAPASFSAATATFLFCVLPNDVQVAALREIARVVEPGGRIVLLEYRWSDHPWRRLLMRLSAPWVRFAYGAGFDRRTEEHAAEAGLVVETRSFLHADIILRLVLRRPELPPTSPGP